MPDEVIKNPNRKTEQIAVKPSKYVPEWQRLGKEPVVFEPNPSDAMFLGNKKKTPKAPVVNSSAAPKMPQQAPGQEHAPVSPPRTRKQEVESPPQQTKVSVGRNSNWFGTTENGAQLTDKQPDIPYDSVEVPDLEVSSDSGATEEETLQTTASSDEEHLLPGEYGILIKDVLIAKTSSLTKAEGLIEKLLFQEVSEFPNVTFDDVMLIHRLPLKIGVLAVQSE